MGISEEDKTSYRWKRYVLGLMAAWTIIIAASLAWNLFEMKERVLETARLQVEAAYEMNMIYRRWNAEHGGIYVEVTDDLRPNPYMSNIPERDVTTPSGKILTLINPALMMRKVHELTKTEHSTRERIISLVPLNPDNLPDPWEAEALRGFERGAAVLSTVELVEGVESMRLIRPLTTAKRCLACHAAQGYVEGDMHGAISISLPMAPLWAAAKSSSYTLVAAHVLLWLLGAGGILLVALRLRRNELERMRMAEELLKVQKLESLGVLAGGIAHDYNNLLTCIMGNISFATQIEDEEIRVYKEKPEGVVLECLMDAEKATLRARDLTKQLTTFSKGGVPVKGLVSDIGELIRESVDFALRGSNVRCEYSVPDGLFTVEADRGQLTQVLDNIVINADQAMPTGGLISVVAENLTIEARDPLPLKPGIYLKITIRDRGAGIPEENRGKVFDPYFTTKEAGSGLGLATAYSIIKKHGGHIALESEVGAGSAFSIYLPASRKKAVIKKAEEAVPARPLKEGEGRVLVMDDDELVSGVARRILSKVGYEVASARHGNEAIDLYTDAKARGRPFDLLILDLTVPGEMGGAEAIKKLLEIDPRVRAIVSSGYSNDPIIEDFKKYGFKGVVVKPYDVAGLRRVVREVLASDEE